MLPRVQCAPAPWQIILFTAADYIEEHGWCQNIGKAPDGRCDVMTAISRQCSTSGPDWRRAVDTFALVIGDVDICVWNDQPGRTKTEIVDRLREAASVNPPGSASDRR